MLIKKMMLLDSEWSKKKWKKFISGFEGAQNYFYYAIIAGKYSNRLKGGEIAGYVIYKKKKKSYEIKKIYINPKLKEEGWGNELIDNLKGKLDLFRPKIKSNVKERNLDQQLFLKKNMFRAIKVIRGYFKDQDAYHMVYMEEF